MDHRSRELAGATAALGIRPCRKRAVQSRRALRADRRRGDRAGMNGGRGGSPGDHWGPRSSAALNRRNRRYINAPTNTSGRMFMTALVRVLALLAIGLGAVATDASAQNYPT